MPEYLTSHTEPKEVLWQGTWEPSRISILITVLSSLEGGGTADKSCAVRRNNTLCNFGPCRFFYFNVIVDHVIPVAMRVSWGKPWAQGCCSQISLQADSSIECSGSIPEGQHPQAASEESPGRTWKVEHWTWWPGASCSAVRLHNLGRVQFLLSKEGKFWGQRRSKALKQHPGTVALSQGPGPATGDGSGPGEAESWGGGWAH